MKVLHVVPSFHPAYVYGGPIQSSYELCSNLAGLGCEVRVLTTDANGLGQLIDVETAREVSMPEGFRVRYCHRRLRHSISPKLVTLLSSYVGWADIVHLTGVYNFPTFPTVTDVPSRWQAFDLVAKGRAAEVGQVKAPQFERFVGF